MGPLLNAHRLFVTDDARINYTISNWADNWLPFYIIVGILYLPFIFTLQFIWKKFNLPAVPYIKNWVLIHNIAFCIFSTIGGIELTTTMWETWVAAGFSFHRTVCDGYFLSKVESHWVHWFVLSKLLELPESIYLILEKKPLHFIHWYHHFMTYTFSVHALVLNNPSAIYYAWMNLVVHAVMYFYYTVATISSGRPSWGILVTIGQILQMFVGTAVTFEILFLCEAPYELVFSFFFSSYERVFIYSL